ncbi:MAG: recombinase family protein [Clostridia bacterium]|nr:recombinase family protein [Clostridia bacterium]
MQKQYNCIAVYSRKSRFTGKGESIGNQVELCKEYIQMHYGASLAENAIVYEDEGFSGGNLNRPDYKRMMEDAKNKKFQAIVVYRLDRISRNISDFAGLIEELSRMDIDFISIREQFDTSSPMGRAMMYISSVFSQLERETIAERIRDNMHELAKTGRWLGGTTPTGYASEAVESVTVDGKTKKACKLKLIPEEAEIVKLIYDLYVETDSQTITEAELLKRGIKTKNGKDFTRFSIKSILHNPVYAIADRDTYDYFVKADSDLFADIEAFDGVHGIMPYNRTDQEKGKTTVFLPPNEWIVTVGLHPGIIPGKVWVGVQESLERNKSKSFRKPRSNEALLTGLLYCSCGSRMYPKLSHRKTADGNPIYTYVCKMKERSRRSICNKKNANGNILDTAIIEQIKLLDDDKGEFIDQLEQSRKFYTGNRTDYEERLAALRKNRDDTEKKIEGLVDSLADMGDSVAKRHVKKRIEQLNQECVDIESTIRELEGLTADNALSDIEFDVLRQLLSVFKSGIDEMTVEQKRAAIRTLVRKVIWDGTNAHVILFGVSDDEIDYPEIPSIDNDAGNDEDDSDELERFLDVDYEDEDFANSTKALLREDSK